MPYGITMQLLNLETKWTYIGGGGGSDPGGRTGAVGKDGGSPAGG